MLCGPHFSLLSTILNNIVTPNSCSILLTSVNNTLFNPVKQQAYNYYACKVVSYTNSVCSTPSVRTFEKSFLWRNRHS